MTGKKTTPPPNGLSRRHPELDRKPGVTSSATPPRSPPLPTGAQPRRPGC